MTEQTDWDMTRLIWGKLSPRVRESLCGGSQIVGAAYHILNQLALIDAKGQRTVLGKKVVEHMWKLSIHPAIPYSVDFRLTK